MAQFYQEYRNQDSGAPEYITSEPLEFWTEEGWEIVPAGFRFYLPGYFRLQENEIKSLILFQWHRIAEIKPERAAVRILRANLIKYPQNKSGAAVARFWRFVKHRAKAELIAFIIRGTLKVCRRYVK